MKILAEDCVGLDFNINGHMHCAFVRSLNRYLKDAKDTVKVLQMCIKIVPYFHVLPDAPNQDRIDNLIKDLAISTYPDAITRLRNFLEPWEASEIPDTIRKYARI